MKNGNKVYLLKWLVLVERVEHKLFFEKNTSTACYLNTKL